MAASFDKTGLEFILTLNKTADAGQPPVNSHPPFGLREVACTNTANVLIDVLGGDTLITIGTDSILLQGINGMGGNAITQQDFHLLG